MHLGKCPIHSLQCNFIQQKLIFVAYTIYSVHYNNIWMYLCITKSWYMYLRVVKYCHKFYKILWSILDIIIGKLFLEIGIYPFPLWFKNLRYSESVPKPEHHVVFEYISYHGWRTKQHEWMPEIITIGRNVFRHNKPFPRTLTFYNDNRCACVGYD